MEEILTQIDAEATMEPKELESQGLQSVSSHTTASFTTEPKSEHTWAPAQRKYEKLKEFGATKLRTVTSITLHTGFT